MSDRQHETLAAVVSCFTPIAGRMSRPRLSELSERAVADGRKAHPEVFQPGYSGGGRAAIIERLRLAVDRRDELIALEGAPLADRYSAHKHDLARAIEKAHAA